MFTAQLVKVDSVGEHVSLALGNWSRQIHYETAILLAHWMHVRGREAKRFTSRGGFSLQTTGTLHDAEKGPDAGQPFTFNRVRTVSRDLLKLDDIEVRQDGTNVALKFGNTEMAIPYAAAITISQWIRLRAKECKRRAGDVIRHHSVIVNDRKTQYGNVTRG